MTRKSLAAIVMSLSAAAMFALPTLAQDATDAATPPVTAVVSPTTVPSTPVSTAPSTAEATETSTAVMTETSTAEVTATATVTPTMTGTAMATSESTAASTAAAAPLLPANAILIKLNDPRGISYDAAGNLYVAEAGSAGTISVGKDPDSGEETFAGISGKITEFSAAGTESAPVPFFVSGGAPGGEIVGASDVITSDSAYWVAVSSLLPQYPFSDGVAEIDKTTGGVITFISPAMIEATQNPDGAEINSNVNALALGPDGTLYIIDSGANTIFSWTQAAGLKTFHVWKDDSVPTAMAFASDGSFYVSFLGQGIAPNAGRVEHWSANDQTLSETFSNLTAVTDVAVGKDGGVYAVELVTGFSAQGPALGSGAVVKLENGAATVVGGNLPQPYGLVQAPDGSWAVSVNSVFSPVDTGAVVKVG